MLLQSPLFLSPQSGRKDYVLSLVNKVENALFLAHPTNPVGRYADANPKLLPNDT